MKLFFPDFLVKGMLRTASLKLRGLQRTQTCFLGRKWGYVSVGKNVFVLVGMGCAKLLV